MIEVQASKLHTIRQCLKISLLYVSRFTIKMPVSDRTSIWPLMKAERAKGNLLLYPSPIIALVSLGLRWERSKLKLLS